jgi:CheY-like chemotaxis protein
MVLLDDDPVCQLAAQRLFKNLGMAVDVASDDAEAVRICAERHPVAVFMDCGSPDTRGYRAARQIRAQTGIENSPPVIAISSAPRDVCLASGMDHHIPKPLRLEALQAACEVLGLVPRPGAAPHHSPAATGSAVPLLEVRAGLTATRAAELASAFAHDALAFMPTLWRAANAADAAALERTAGELGRRGRRGGARGHRRR